MGRIYKFDDEIGLKVLGFKARSVLKTSHNVTHSTFVYPDESVNLNVRLLSYHIFLDYWQCCYFCLFIEELFGNG